MQSTNYSGDHQDLWQVGTYIPSTAASPAKILPVGLEQMTWGDQDSGWDSRPKNTSPRRCSTPSPGIGLDTGAMERDYLQFGVNRSNVRHQESMDTDWKPYGRADTFMYHLTQHTAFTPQCLREPSSHLMSSKGSSHQNSWWMSNTPLGISGTVNVGL